MSDIFALQGRGGSGKTATIKMIYEELLKKYPTAHVQNLFPQTKDINIILSNINGHVVGIESQGDPNTRLQESLQYFCNAKCDIIICAVRTTGMTVNWVNSYSGTYNVHFIQQTYDTTTNQDATNLRMAQNIIIQAGL